MNQRHTFYAEDTDAAEDFNRYSAQEGKYKRLLSNAKILAQGAHRGRMCGDVPYSEHVQRLAQQVESELGALDYTIIAMLYGITELEGGCKKEVIRCIFGAYISDMVELLERRDKTLEQYYGALSGGYVSVKIKAIEKYLAVRALEVCGDRGKMEEEMVEIKKYLFPLLDAKGNDIFYGEYKSKFEKLFEMLVSPAAC